MAKSDAERLWERVEQVVKEYNERDSMLDALEDYYFLEGAKEEDEEAEDEGIEIVRGPHGTNAVDLVQDLMMKAELLITVPARSEKVGDKTLADDAEDWLAGLVAETERSQGQGFLERAAWLVAMRGCLVARVLFMESWLKEKRGAQKLYDSDEDVKTADGLRFEQGQRCPILLQWRDARYVYPGFGADGLTFVVEQAKRTVRDVRETFGEEVLAGKDEDEEIEWTEYWDGEQFCYWAAGEVVEKPVGMEQERREQRKGGPWKHNYGGIPYVYRFARQTGVLEPERRVRPLLESMRKTIDRIDLLDSMQLTFVKQYGGDAVVVYSEEDDVSLDTRPGAINYLQPEEKVEWLRAGRQPMELEQVRGKLEAVFERGTFPHTMFGADPGRMMAGYALNLLNQGGMMRLRPLIRCVEETAAGVLGRALMVAEKRLAPLVGGEVQVYVFGEDAEGRKVRKAVGFKAGKMEGYWEVECALEEMLQQDEQANLVMALRARQAGADGRPLLSWETVLDRFGLAGDVGKERMRIDRELAWTDEEVQALGRAVLVESVKAEYREKLMGLGLDPDEVLERQRVQRAQRMGEQQMGGEAMAAGFPPEMMAPQMQGGGQPMSPEELAMAQQLGMGSGVGPGPGVVPGPGMGR